MCDSCVRVGYGQTTVFLCGMNNRVATFKVGRATITVEWHHYLGPTFVNPKGEVLDRIPSETNPVWDMIDKWRIGGFRTDQFGRAVF